MNSLREFSTPNRMIYNRMKGKKSHAKSKLLDRILTFDLRLIINDWKENSVLDWKLFEVFYSIVLSLSPSLYLYAKV